MKINKGDKILCVNDEGSDLTTIGNVYEALCSANDGNLVSFLNDKGKLDSVFGNRFIRCPKVGESVRFIKFNNNSNWSQFEKFDGLTIGKVYKVRCYGNTEMYIYLDDHGLGHKIEDFEIVESSMFKVGDKVVCIDREDLQYIQKGSVYTISKVGVDDTICLAEIQNDFGSHRYYSKQFELLHSNDQVIISQFNELVEAGKVRYYKDNSFRNIPKGVVYSLMPTKVFSLSAISGWTLEIKDQDIKIGCQTFQMAPLLKNLQDLIENNANKSGSFVACKKGIGYHIHVMPWADAEKLMNALRDYLK